MSLVSGTRSIAFLKKALVNPRTVNVPLKLFAASSCAWVAWARISSTEATKWTLPAAKSTWLFASGFLSGTGAVLAEIDPFTGAGRVIGPTGFDSVAGLEVASDGSLLGSVGGVDANAGGLVRIDPLTGHASLIGLTGFSPVSGLTRLP